MNNKAYLSPQLRTMFVAPHGRLLQDVASMQNNAGLVLGGEGDDGDDDNRVKSGNYNVWDDDWSR